MFNALLAKVGTKSGQKISLIGLLDDPKKHSHAMVFLIFDIYI